MNKVPVSVIIPCYRCKDTIARALDSITAQSALPAEIIIVDDCSPDDSLQFIQHLTDRYPNDWIEVVSLPVNRGPGAARNEGWAAATQPYIAFLDADDAWHPDKLNIQYHWMAAHSFASISGHSCAIGLPEGVLTRYRSNELKFRPVNRYKMLFSNSLLTRSVMLKRDVPFRFDRSKRYSEDFLLWLNLIFSGHSAWRLDIPLAYTFKADYGETGLSAHLWQMEKGEIECFLSLYKTKHISFLLLAAILSFSGAKFIRRLIISRHHHLKKRFIE